MKLEDFTGNSEFAFFGEDYVRYANYFVNGLNLLVEGCFKSRYNTDQYEFRISRLHLLETVKTTLTKGVVLDLEASLLDEAFINFMSHNVSTHPGSTSFKININEKEGENNVSLYTLEKGISVNDELAEFLDKFRLGKVTVVT